MGGSASKADLDRAYETNALLRKKIDGIQKEKQVVDAQVLSLRQELDQVRGELQKLLQKSQADAEKRKKELKRLEEDTEKGSSARESKLQDEIRDANKKLQALNAKYSTLVEQSKGMDATKRELELLKKRYNDLLKQKASLKAIHEDTPDPDEYDSEIEAFHKEMRDACHKLCIQFHEKVVIFVNTCLLDNNIPDMQHAVFYVHETMDKLIGFLTATEQMEKHSKLSTAAHKNDAQMVYDVCIHVVEMWRWAKGMFDATTLLKKHERDVQDTMDAMQEEQRVVVEMLGQKGLDTAKVLQNVFDQIESFLKQCRDEKHETPVKKEISLSFAREVKDELTALVDSLMKVFMPLGVCKVECSLTSITLTVEDDGQIGEPPYDLARVKKWMSSGVMDLDVDVAKKILGIDPDLEMQLIQHYTEEAWEEDKIYFFLEYGKDTEGLKEYYERSFRRLKQKESAQILKFISEHMKMRNYSDTTKSWARFGGLANKGIDGEKSELDENDIMKLFCSYMHGPHLPHDQKHFVSIYDTFFGDLLEMIGSGKRPMHKILDNAQDSDDVEQFKTDGKELLEKTFGSTNKKSLTPEAKQAAYNLWNEFIEELLYIRQHEENIGDYSSMEEDSEDDHDVSDDDNLPFHSSGKEDSDSDNNDLEQQYPKSECALCHGIILYA